MLKNNWSSLDSNFVPKLMLFHENIYKLKQKILIMSFPCYVIDMFFVKSPTNFKHFTFQLINEKIQLEATSTFRRHANN